MRRVAVALGVLVVVMLSSCSYRVSLQPPGREWVDVKEVNVVARQFEFVPSRVVVPVGVPIKLVVTSVDVDHQLGIRGLSVQQREVKGRKTTLWMTPRQTGEYQFACDIACGTGHERMQGVLVVE